MIWCISNTIGKNMPGHDDFVRPIKQGNDNEIDGAVALIMSVGATYSAEGEGDMSSAAYVVRV